MTRRTIAVILVSLAVHLLLAAWLPLSGDETYHWWWAMHPASSFQEHPPLQAYLIRGCVALLGHHAVAVRLPAMLSGAAVALLSVKILLRLNRGPATPADPAGFALLLNLLPLYFILAAYANNDMMLYAFALAVLYGVWRLSGAAVSLRSDKVLKSSLECATGGDSGERWAVWIGPLLALALLTKLIALLLIPVLIYGLARRGSRLPARFWAGLAAGAVMLIPFILWNCRYGWPVLGIRLGHKTTQYVPHQFLLELIGPELLGVTPLVFGAVFWFALRGTGLAANAKLWRLAALLLLVPYHLMALIQHVDPHWPFLGFVLLLPAMWIGWPRGRRALLYSSAACMAGVVLFVTLTLGQALNWRYALRASRLNASRAAAQFIGWRELRDRLAAESATLKPGSFIIAEGYGMLTQGLFLLDGKREGYLVENPVRSGGSIAYFEKQHPPPRGVDAIYVAEADSRTEAEIRRKLALLFTALEPADNLEVCRGEICRRFLIIRLRGFRGFDERRHFYEPEKYLGMGSRGVPPVLGPVKKAAP